MITHGLFFCVSAPRVGSRSIQRISNCLYITDLNHQTGGYLPRFNYQKILEEKVIDYLIQNQSIENQFKSFADKEVFLSLNPIPFEKILVEAPENNIVSDPIMHYERNPLRSITWKESRKITNWDY